MSTHVPQPSRAGGMPPLDQYHPHHEAAASGQLTWACARAAAVVVPAPPRTAPRSRWIDRRARRPSAVGRLRTAFPARGPAAAG